MTQTAAERRYVRLAAANNSKATRLGAPGRITAVTLAEAYLRSEGVCPYCRISIDPLHCSFDHVIPFDHQGPNEAGNIVACCLTCQRSKGTKDVKEFQKARVHMATCTTCGKVFRPRWADVKRGFGTTCSRSCSGTKGGES